MTGITTGNGNAVQNLSYTYDSLSNPLSRSDANTNLSETFTYDALNRLTSATVSLSPAPLVKTFSYSAIGNILSKSDVGNYGYAAPGSPLPHAVVSTSGGALTSTFTYDPNGNQTAGLGRTITYSSYNKPASITQGARTISFVDDTEHQRFKQVTPEGNTLYIAAFGVLAEISNPGTASAKWTDYLSVGNAKVGMRTLQVASETLATRYFHTDHLGSISVITNEYGVVVERLSYDAWGKRRNPDGTDDTTGSITSQSTRGFTGEEQLSVSGLVHLNGRVYDPLLARMTSADPTVTDPMNPQGWNRYSYVGNDPLAFTDPSGYSWLSNAWHGVTNFLSHNAVARAVVQIVVAVVISAILTPAVGAGIISASTSAAVSAAGSAVIATGLSGGNLSQMLRAGAIAGATAFAFFQVGDITNAFAGANPGPLGQHGTPTFGTDAYFVNVTGHALVGCGSSVASGGSCASGALAGAAGAAGAPFMSSMNGTERLVASAVLGGVGSVAGGGKFANGAVTGAFGYLFNAGAGAVGRMLEGSEAHRALQAWLQQQGIGGLFTERSSDGQGTSFWGRVDIGNSVSNEIWEIKPDNPVGFINARVMAEFYSITASGTDPYKPGGVLPLPAPGEVRGISGTSYTYVNAGDGAILWRPYRSATQGVSLSTVTQGGALMGPSAASSLLFR